MNKLREKLKELKPTCSNKRKPMYIQLMENILGECIIEKTNFDNYTFNLYLKLGSSITCPKKDISKIKEYVISQLIDELYGDIHSDLIRLQVALWEENREKLQEIISKLIMDTRP